MSIMKFYETNYDEYILNCEQYNLHPEYEPIFEKLPEDLVGLKNTIFYGAPGVGKYTQVLQMLKKYSPSHLKYNKKLKIQTDKQTYSYHISDIHFEIDMSLLGCNSKLIWNELFLQMIDILSVRQHKIGVIVCKNFHTIHSELLDIFYSYIQQYNYPDLPVQVRFILLTEHLSFIPNNIMNCCQLFCFQRPSNEMYVDFIKSKLVHTDQNSYIKTQFPFYNLADWDSIYSNSKPIQHFINKITSEEFTSEYKTNIMSILNKIDKDCILNLKEIYSFSNFNEIEEIPSDNFNLICDQIIQCMKNYKSLSFENFRNILYDMLIYNLDIIECIWTILTHFIQTGELSSEDIGDILIYLQTALKYYNNNYRPISHLESIFYYIINKLHHIE